MSETTAFALTLQKMDGIGRAIGGRLLRHFPSYDTLLQYPREQILVRLKGLPRAENIVRRLMDEEAMRNRLTTARDEQDRLGRKGVTLITPASDEWPAGLNDLPHAQRPFILYAYGSTDVLQKPTVALLADPPLDDAPFEAGQALTRHLTQHDVAPATGASTGFDIVIHKISSSATPPRPSLLCASCGFAVFPARMRPTVTAAVRAGGLFVSPFPMRHGPFDHDVKMSSLLLCALSSASVFIDPKERTPSAAALQWARQHKRNLFALASPSSQLPEEVEVLEGPSDFSRVVDAATDQ